MRRGSTKHQTIDITQAAKLRCWAEELSVDLRLSSTLWTLWERTKGTFGLRPCLFEWNAFTTTTTSSVVQEKLSRRVHIFGLRYLGANLLYTNNFYTYLCIDGGW